MKKFRFFNIEMNRNLKLVLKILNIIGLHNYKSRNGMGLSVG